MLYTLFPDLCWGCSKNPKSRDTFFCLQCLQELPFTDHFKLKNNSVNNHFLGRFPIHHAGALFLFKQKGPVQNMLHQLKYHKKSEVGWVLGELLAKAVMECPYLRHVDVIIPIPIHNDKKKERGYNQCEIIGQSLSQFSGIPIIKDVVKKIVHNESQTGKNRLERIENVKSAYELNELRVIKGLNILVLDDVITTGATVEACCIELLKGQPASISVIAIASEN